MGGQASEYDELSPDEIINKIIGKKNIKSTGPNRRAMGFDPKKKTFDDDRLTENELVSIGESVEEFLKKNHPKVHRKIERYLSRNESSPPNNNPPPDPDPDDSGIFNRLANFAKWCWDKVAFGAGIVGFVLSYILGLSIPRSGFIGLGAYILVRLAREVKLNDSFHKTLSRTLL